MTITLAVPFFHRDLGMIVHSNYFKRLAQKTQVHSLPDNDHIRTRLTHSIEASQIGRQITRSFCEKVVREKLLSNDGYFSFKEELEELTAATCLVHDIGHAPFGHIGKVILDHVCPPVHKFDDNKQVVRILLNGILGENLRPSAPLVLSTLKKFEVPDAVYDLDIEQIVKLQTALGLEEARHPASHFMEAADDISYLAADVMDYFTYFVSSKKITSVHHGELIDLLHNINIIQPCSDQKAKTLGDLYSKASTSGDFKDFSDHLLKAALYHVIQAFDVFVSETRKELSLDSLPILLSSFIKRYAYKYKKNDADKTDFNLAYLGYPGDGKRGETFFKIKQVAYNSLILNEGYIATQNVHAKLVISGLWDFFVKEICGLKSDENVIHMLPAPDQAYILRAIDIGGDEPTRAICDLISGMTDRYANSLWGALGNPVTLKRAG